MICAFWAAVVALIYMVVFTLFGAQIIGMLTNVEEVRTSARQFLPWLIVAPLVAVWSYLLDGIFVGAMQTKSMRNGMVLSFAVYFPACHILIDLWGAHGLWLALLIFLAMRGVTLAYAYPGVERRATKSAG